MLWIAIYFVKFCFLAQFNFHQPPYSYVSIHLTRYYWISVGTCLVAFSISIIQPIVLCHSQSDCRYFNRANNLSWENAITIVDIFSTIQVPSILIPLIYMANLSRRRAVINIIFKGLFAVTIGIATLRLVLQYDGQGLRLDYVVITFWLIVEAVISLITMSISSYRAVVLDMLSSVDSQPREFLNPINVLNGTQVIQNSSPLQRKCTISRSNGESLSEIPMLQPP
ncbi:hypothetical protein P154DRAFT_446453 [Amniculicola lignicola CBS 123094]|uniref:Integral membrane protein n=1 Tax=Amniculicola lignicola CBS 123094 TaxID=1392246 RepID=A0A6A5VZK8_9PLEO|nr:hypothetical protein P154DRAFT_446453 [Amniculicola lignicola CBS 123094]